MKFDFHINKLLAKLGWYHPFFVVAIITLLSIGYAKWVYNPISPDILQHIQNNKLTDENLLERNAMQVLFMKERGWFFILFGALVLSIFLWIGISNRKQKSRTFIGYKYSFSEKLANTVKNRLHFQERLRLKYDDLTPNDLVVAEMLVDGLTSKEISNELNISPASANTARYRLRKRMELSSQTDLIDVLRNI